MKKFLFFVWATFFANVSFSQNTLPPNGNVGIGTLTPGSPLTIIGDLHASGTIGGNGGFINVLKIPPLDYGTAYFYINTNIPATDYSAPQIQITGYMYAATNKAMRVTLGWYHYQGDFFWSQWQNDLGYQKPSRIRIGTYLKNGSPFIRIEISNNSVYWSNYSVSATDFSDSSFAYYSGWTFEKGEMPAETTSQIHIVSQNEDVTVDGNMGIGTSDTKGYKLAVNGKIRAHEIKVEVANWPDFVFAKGYKIPTLLETEYHIKQHGHLPGIPSAEEVKVNGIDLGEMNAKLLEKIEELTLHLIEKDKEIKKLEQLNDRIKDLELKMKTLMK